MDIDEASYRQVVQDLQELYGKKIAPFHLPIRENGQFVGYVNVLQQRAKRWKENGEVEKTDVPDYSKENLGICREALMEAVAETSEEFMDRYFGGEEFSEDEIRQALRVNVAEGSIVPVLMGSNILARGIYTLLVDIVKYLPSPEKRTCTGINAKTNEVYNAITISQRQNPPISGKQSQILYGNIPLLKSNFRRVKDGRHLIQSA